MQSQFIFLGNHLKPPLPLIFYKTNKKKVVSYYVKRGYTPISTLRAILTYSKMKTSLSLFYKKLGWGQDFLVIGN